MRARMPLPSNTQGPASLRGVIGPSPLIVTTPPPCPAAAAPLGEGVRVPPCRDPVGPAAAEMRDAEPERCEAAEEDGMGHRVRGGVGDGRARGYGPPRRGGVHLV